MSSKKRARGKNTVLNTKKKLKGLPENKKNKVWSDEEMNIFARVLANTDTVERSWLYQLENYALKKHANEELFRKIQEEFEEALPEDSAEYRFTIDQLRAKYKWFKKEWRRIDTKIKAGTGLGGKDTTTPCWYDVLNPHFCEAVDDMTSISTKASDLDIYNSSSGEDQPKSDDDASTSDNSLDNSFNTCRNTSGDMSDSSTKSSIVSEEIQNPNHRVRQCFKLLRVLRTAVFNRKKTKMFDFKHLWELIENEMRCFWLTKESRQKQIENTSY
jgi:hypothetical protein